MPRVGRARQFGSVLTLSVLAIVAVAISRSSASGGAPALCDQPKESYFACRTRNGKLIELCGGKTVEYRFGKPGKVELAYPAAPGDGPLRFAHYARPATDRIEISFSAGGADYSVFDYSEGKKRTAGVRATLASGKEVTIACKGPIVSRLGALEKILPCDTDSALNLGGCPQ
jgi:hypothetical protein